MESYGTIDERSAATPKKLVGRRIIAAVAAVALVVGASAAVSVNRRPGDCIQTGIAADGSISCDGGGCPQTGSTAKGGITCPDDPCAKCGEGGMTGRPRAFYSPPGQPPIPVPNCVWKIKSLRRVIHAIDATPARWRGGVTLTSDSPARLTG